MPEILKSLAGTFAAAAIAFALGLYFSRFLKSRGQTSVEISEDEETDDPTAPIAPVVEMGRSPHDRHRDLAIGRGIIKQIDLVDSMEKASRKRGEEENVRQLGMLRGEFLAMLSHCSMERITYEPGTVVDSTIRTRIQIVGGSVSGERTLVDETISPGYLYDDGDGDPTIVRKAEITIR